MDDWCRLYGTVGRQKLRPLTGEHATATRYFREQHAMIRERCEIELLGHVGERDERIPLITPTLDEHLQGLPQFHPFQFGMKRKDFKRATPRRRKLKQTSVNILAGHTVETNELVERRQRRGNLWAARDLRVPHR